jgi:hypothetical protein
VVCLQELKAPDAAFPINDIHAAGYGAIWHGQTSWNGVAILVKGMDPLESRRGLPGGEGDTHLPSRGALGMFRPKYETKGYPSLMIVGVRRGEAGGTLHLPNAICNRLLKTLLKVCKAERVYSLDRYE